MNFYGIPEPKNLRMKGISKSNVMTRNEVRSVKRTRLSPLAREGNGFLSRGKARPIGGMSFIQRMNVAYGGVPTMIKKKTN